MSKVSVGPTHARVAVAAIALVIGCAERSGAAAPRKSESAEGPPRIVATIPAVGATEVDPATSEIKDRRTCVLPVRLEPNHRYRLGLNSRSHRNFRSAAGVSLAPVVYVFHTGE